MPCSRVFACVLQRSSDWFVFVLLFSRVIRSLILQLTPATTCQHTQSSRYVELTPNDVFITLGSDISVRPTSLTSRDCCSR